jgi:hypothetical protein
MVDHPLLGRLHNPGSGMTLHTLTGGPIGKPVDTPVANAQAVRVPLDEAHIDVDELPETRTPAPGPTAV